MQVWPRNNSVNVLDWPRQSRDMNPIQNLWGDLKIAVHRWSPFNPSHVERICRLEWQKIPKSWLQILLCHTTEDLRSVTAVKGISTKYWAKGLNTYADVIFQFFIVNRFANISKILFFTLSLLGFWMLINEGEKNKTAVQQNVKRLKGSRHSLNAVYLCQDGCQCIRAAGV